jgi:hypothetical protein
VEQWRRIVAGVLGRRGATAWCFDRLGRCGVLGRDPDEAQEWVRSWTGQVSAQAHAAAELSDRVAAVTASASEVDGAVR